ncbi:hypothetical protein [Paenibacillus sp. Y412MC10]|nr:hypothetical protein [Paenibacillus sp. Y412MC10]
MEKKVIRLGLGTENRIIPPPLSAWPPLLYTDIRFASDANFIGYEQWS